MKFMKLGSKPDIFQSDGNKIRYVATELASDIIVSVGDVKFYLHKFPLLSKSAQMQKLVAIATAENSEEVHIPDIPGGPAAFEMCAKFCYGIAVTVNAYNVFSARCAADYLGMNETVEKGNLTYKIDVFLSSSIFRSWKDSIILLQSTTALSLLLTEDLKVVSHCIDSIACKASINTSRVDWSYTYNEVHQKMLLEENGSRRTPKDWWVEDLCELDIDLFKRVIMSIKSKGVVSNVVIGDALKAYAHRKLSELDKDHKMIESSMVETIVWLLPSEKNSVSCSFLFNLLKAANAASSGEMLKRQLIRKIGLQLEEASVNDLLIRSPEGGHTIYDVDVVMMIVKEYVMQDQSLEIEEIKEMNRRSGILSDASKLMVAKAIDGYLAEIAKDPNLPLSKFVDLAEMVTGFTRSSHDGIYRAIDTFLKEHDGITKSERKRICKLMDSKKLSADACVHAVQNERLPMRVIVQVLFFEQIRANALSGSSTPDLPKCITDLTTGSNGSSRSATTNTEEDWDALATAEELKALKEELATLKLRSRSSRVSEKSKGNSKNVANKTKGSLMPNKMFARMWSSKGGQGENCGSEFMESPGSVKLDESKITPSRNRRFSVS